MRTTTAVEKERIKVGKELSPRSYETMHSYTLYGSAAERKGKDGYKKIFLPLHSFLSMVGFWKGQNPRAIYGYCIHNFHLLDNDLDDPNRSYLASSCMSAEPASQRHISWSDVQKR